MGGRPAVRARSAQDWLEYLEKIQPGLRERVIERIPEPSREIITTAPRTEWIPLEHDRYVPWATIEEMGEEAAVESWRLFLKSHIQAPIFRTLAESMVRLFGLTPSTFVRLLPRAWNQAYRDCCGVEVIETGENRAHAAFTEVATGILEWEAYLISWRGVLGGAFAIMDIEGELQMRVNEDRARIDAVWTW
jgi:hypothetical protein